MSTTRITLDLNDHQITKLRELMDALPLAAYHDLILPVLKALPLESADVSPSVADTDRQALSYLVPAGSFFSLNARTAKGRAMLPQIEEMFSRLPHGEDL